MLIPVFIMMTLLCIHTSIFAADTGEITFTNKNADGTAVQQRQKTTYEFMVYSSDNLPDNEEYPVESTIGLEKIKSYDRFSLSNQQKITISDLPANSRVEFTPVSIAPQYSSEKLVYSKKIEAGKTVDVVANNKVNAQKRVGFYPNVTTKVEGEAPAGIKIKYKIKCTSKTNSSLEDPDPDEIETDLYGTDLFSYVLFPSSGTYVYEITPVETDVKGLKLDTKTVTETVEVKTVDESYEEEISYDPEPVFIHQYEYPETQYSPEVRKEIDGENPGNESFEFYLTQEEEQDGVVMPATNKISVDAGSTGEFLPITFKKPGDFNFKIAEQVQKRQGYTFDSKIYNLSLHVLNQISGLVIDNPVYTSEDQTEDRAVFTNIYESGTLKIKKEVENSDFEGPYKITITLEDEDSNPLQGSYPYTSSKKENNGNITNGSQIEISKDEEITITKLPAGAHYTISEEIPQGFVLESDTATGEIEKDKETQVTLINKYEPTPVSYMPQIKKSVTGDPPIDETFYFDLELTSQNKGDVTIQNSKYSATGTATATGEPIVFLREGTFEFRITEEDTKLLGYEYDKSTWNLRVEVESENGNLSVKSAVYTRDQEAEEALFENNYISGNLMIDKKVSGRTGGETFKFKLTLKNAEGENLNGTFPATYSNGNTSNVSSGDTLELQANENVKIDKLPVGCDYEIEEIEIPNGYSPESALQKGKISQGENDVGFLNTYVYAPVSFVPKVTKSVDGIENPKDTFAFILRRDEENDENDPVKEDKRVSVVGIGEAEFEALNYTHPGIYSYTIFEDPSPVAGYILDDSVWNLVVEIADDGTGNLKLESLYSRERDNIESELAQFTNVYRPESVNYAVTVNKKVEGDAPEEDTYTFELSESQEYLSVVMPEERRLTITGEGTGVFSPITFNSTGNYVFLISEVDEEKPGYSYDKTVWEVAVTVVADGAKLRVESTDYRAKENADNTKEVSEEYKKALRESQASFYNEYAGGNLEIAKVVQGGSEDKFTFSLKLTDKSGNEVKGSFPYRGNSDGTLSSGSTFELGDGEHITILNLPAGINYSVEEEKNANYNITSSGASGMILENTTSYASFSNSPVTKVTQQTPTLSNPTKAESSTIQNNSVPKTGDERNIFRWSILLCLSLGGTIYYFCRRHKKRINERLLHKTEMKSNSDSEHEKDES